MVQNFWNKIYLQDSRIMEKIPDNSIHLMVTSPPYNVTKQYDDNLTLQEYLSLIEAVLTEVFRVLVPGGIIALNVANVGRKPYIPFNCLFIEILQGLKYNIMQEIIWNKAASAGGSCAWGSWKSASNPSLRDVHEYIIIAQKPPLNGNGSLVKISHSDIPKLPEKLDDKNHSINKNELFTNIWSFGTESATRVNHPAPFRVELPYRVIQMFTNESDIILDPFMGSGSTALAAIIANRRYIGFEINPEYINLTNRRIDEYYHPEKKKQRLKEERIRKKALKEKQKKETQKSKTTKKLQKKNKQTDLAL